MKEKDTNHGDHHHHHGGVFGERTELIFAILSGVFFLTGIAISWFTNFPHWVSLSCFIATYFFGGYYATLEAIEKIGKGEFEIDFLMIVAAIGAAFIDSWGEGALLLFLFSLGHALENYALEKAKKSIEALGDLSPKTALIKRGDELIEIGVEELKINDIIVVKPNVKIAADGVIIHGRSSVNQAAITGESMPVDKTPIDNLSNIPLFEDLDNAHVVFTGTLNGDNLIEVRVLKLSEDSTIARLVQMVSEAETKKSPTQRLTKKFEKWFVPIVIIMVFVLCFAYLVIDETVNESLYRAISVLVAASPCALAISTPSAVLSGIARAAKGGVLIKGGKVLEDLGTLTTIAFDKTGTLTQGKPSLTYAEPLNGYDKTKFLQLVLEVESLSNHPLAKAMVNNIQESYGLVLSHMADESTAIQGKGIHAKFNNKDVFIGNERLMSDNQVQVSKEIQALMTGLLNQGQTAMLVAYQQEPIGLLGLMDIPRNDAKETLKKLSQIGVTHMVMLTGDHQHVGEAIAKQIGIPEVKGGLLPEDKVKAITALKLRDTKIAMVGDGVNDAPAMASSTVGIAMGATGSDVALETADVALMSDNIKNLPFVIGLSRKSRSIIKQNLWISLGVVALLIPTALMGWVNIGGTVAMHEGSTLIVVLNALRLLAYKPE